MGEFGISLEPNFHVIVPLLSGLTKMPSLAWANFELWALDDVEGGDVAGDIMSR